MEKSLNEYSALLDSKGLLINCNAKEAGSTPVCGITYDSREVKPGYLFVCKGAAFKKEFLEKAVRAGCAAYVSEVDYGIAEVPCMIVSDVRDAMPHIAKLFYELPKNLKIIGITGTKGKTTTAYYIKRVFDEAMRMQGKPEIAFISTVETYDGKERISTGITTPESFELYRHFKNACDSGIEYIVMEVSSQALKYKRTDGITFDTAVFLNISEDHISPVEHPDFNDYFGSKLKIFSQCRTAAVCSDTDRFKNVMEAAGKAEEAVTFGMSEDADIYAFNISANDDSTAFCVKYKEKKYDFILDMRGRFNVENAMAAVAVAFKYGLPYEAVRRALENVSVPGRGEEYSSADDKIKVIVDYAHNGLSVRNIVGMAKEQWKERKIISVFGCPGGKGLNRRRDMGIAAGELSDMIYLTADDPANEKVSDICAEIGGYVEKTGCRYKIIEDRREAVVSAILGCSGPSVVLLLGKGAEKEQKMPGGAEAYESDAVIARMALEEYNKNLSCSGGRE
jgi:UDP-N-acetylmuramyl-tripeptide synthetase